MRVLSVQGTLRFLKILKLTRIPSIQEKRALYSSYCETERKLFSTNFTYIETIQGVVDLGV